MRCVVNKVNLLCVLLIPLLWSATILSFPAQAGSDFGLPGEEFTGFRYPLETSWQVESNPAFLPSIDRKSFYGGFFPQFESSYLASAVLFVPVRTSLGFPDNRNGAASVALMVRNINVGDIEGRGLNNETLGTFSDSKTLISILYGQKFAPGLSLGVGFKYISYSTSKISGGALEGLSKSAFGTDFGICLEPIENVDLGLAVSNAPLQPNVTLINEEEKWPITVHFDVGVELMDERLLLVAGTDYIRNDQRGEGDAILRPEAGADYRIHDKLIIGAGFANGQPTGGARLELPGLTFQYSLENSDLGLLHYASVGFAFGSTGQERYLALSEALPDKLFAEALRLYRLGRHYEAADKFALFHNRYPQDDRGDDAVLYLARCFEGFGALDGAEYFCNKLVTEHPRSELCAAALADIVRLRYEVADQIGIVQAFDELHNRYPTSPAASDSRYFIGMTMLKRENYREAKNYLELVPSSSENFLFAQYGIALCYLNDPDTEEVSRLQKTIGAFTSVLVEREKLTAKEKVLRDRSALVLGHLLREKGDLKGAIDKYRNVAEQPFYMEACIASAYCYYDLGQFDAGIRIADEVISSNTGDSYFAEAMLVKQECLQARGLESEAAQIRSQLHEMLAGEAGPSETHPQEIADLQAELGARRSEANSNALAYARHVEQAADDRESNVTPAMRRDMVASLDRLESASTKMSEYEYQIIEQRKLKKTRNDLVLATP